MREELVMPIFIKKAMNGEPLTIAGDGLQPVLGGSVPRLDLR